MKRRAFLRASIVVGSALAVPSRAAPPQGKGHGADENSRANKDKGSQSAKGRGELGRDDSGRDLVYAGITAALVRGYAYDLGLRGYSPLPPGIRKNLARGKPLPPGIAKKLVPEGLLARLPQHPGYEWRVTGTDLILISIATAVIADVLYDALN